MNPLVPSRLRPRPRGYSTGFKYGRSYVGRQVKTYTTKPKTWVDKAWLAAEGVGWILPSNP